MAIFDAIYLDIFAVGKLVHQGFRPRVHFALNETHDPRGKGLGDRSLLWSLSNQGPSRSQYLRTFEGVVDRFLSGTSKMQTKLCTVRGRSFASDAQAPMGNHVKGLADHT
jgi:hypothetical protein